MFDPVDVSEEVTGWVLSNVVLELAFGGGLVLLNLLLLFKDVQ